MGVGVLTGHGTCAFVPQDDVGGNWYALVMAARHTGNSAVCSAICCVGVTTHFSPHTHTHREKESACVC